LCSDNLSLFYPLTDRRTDRHVALAKTRASIASRGKKYWAVQNVTFHMIWHRGMENKSKFTWCASFGGDDK